VTEAAGKSVRGAVLGAAAIIAITVLFYLPAIPNGFVWDDEYAVTQNPTVRDFGGLVRTWTDLKVHQQYYPLTHTSFWAEFQLWQLWAPGYHIVNILLHALAAVLLWILLRSLSVPGAWLAAVVFAIHPVNVESVAWITERKNTLAGVFYIASALAYVRFAGLDSVDRGRPTRVYWTAAALFVCAMLSKTAAAPLPIALLIITWWKRKRLTRDDIEPIIPLICVAAGFGMLTAWIEKTHVGAQGDEFALGLADKIIVAGRALWFYVSKTLWPDPIIFIYPRWDIDPSRRVQFIYPVSFFALVAALWLLRGRIGKGPFAAVAYYLVAVAPALGFFNVYFMRYTYVQDHFQYFAIIGTITLTVSALTVAINRLTSRRAVAMGAAAALILVLGVITAGQSRVYQSSETLFRDTLKKNPDAWMAHLNLIKVLYDRGDLEEALDHYDEVIRLRQSADALIDAGGFSMEPGRIDDAIRYYRSAVEMEPGAMAYFNLGMALEKKGAVAEAISAYRAALELDPNRADIRNLLGVLLMNSDDYDAAIREFTSALEIDPSLQEARDNLDTALYNKARTAR